VIAHLGRTPGQSAAEHRHQNQTRRSIHPATRVIAARLRTELHHLFPVPR
jgi:hypothetical protein